MISKKSVLSEVRTYIYKISTYHLFFQGNTLFEGVFGDKEANNAGEYLSVDTSSGDLMVYTDSDTVGGGFAFLKLSPN